MTHAGTRSIEGGQKTRPLIIDLVKGHWFAIRINDNAFCWLL